MHHRSVQAALCVIIFLLATLAAMPQASAHYTLGGQLPGSIGEENAGGLPGLPHNFAQFHLADGAASGHVAGHNAFVQPGSLYVPPSDQGTYYSPDGAVLTNSVGDLYFYICLDSPPINISWRAQTTTFKTRTPGSSWELSKWLYIAIPPEFTPPADWEAGWGDLLTTNQGLGDTSNIETTITNDHNMIQTGKFGPRHPVAPNWWFVRITAEPRDFPLNAADLIAQYPDLAGEFDDTYLTNPNWMGSSGFLYPPWMDPWVDRQLRKGDFAGCYRIKVHDMKAPNVAGKFFFKIFYTSTREPYYSMGGLYWFDWWQAPDPPAYLGGVTYENDHESGYMNGYFEKYDTFPPENYPVILVKGEVDPGYISGTVRYGGSYYYGYYYGAGVYTSGKVVAEGTALDPYTKEPTGRPVCGVGWFLGELPGQHEEYYAWDRETGSEGYYEIEGLAPGIYTLTAYAAGFQPRTLGYQVTIYCGQSVQGLDIYVYPAAKLQTSVYSKCPTGPVDFPDYVTLDGFPASLQTLPVVPGGADVRGGQPVQPGDGDWYWFIEGATTVQAKDIWAEHEQVVGVFF